MEIEGRLKDYSEATARAGHLSFHASRHGWLASVGCQIRHLTATVFQLEVHAGT